MKIWNWALGVALGCAVGCVSKTAEEDSRTTWLSGCTEDTDCGSQLACVCGVCTVVCEQAACDLGPAAVCRQSASVIADCSGTQICTQRCDSPEECPFDLECRSGSCVQPQDDAIEPMDAARPVLDARVPGVTAPAVTEPEQDAQVAPTPKPPLDASVTPPPTASDPMMLLPPSDMDAEPPGDMDAAPEPPSDTVPEMGGPSAATDAADATAPKCDLNTLDTNQGNTPPEDDQCAAIGAALKEAHDLALIGEQLEVEPLAGTWVVGTGAARIELVLDQAGVGTLRFGEATDLPEITDPDAAYLSIGPNEAGAVFDLEHLRPRLGFAYSVVAENGRSSEMSFHISTMEVFEDWCTLQSPVKSPYARACYACMEDMGVYSLLNDCAEQSGCYAGVSETGDTAELERTDCGRFELCLMPYYNACNCTADECFANVEYRSQITEYSYDVSLDPVDTTVLRLESLSELLEKTTYYLDKQVASAAQQSDRP